MTHEEMMGKVWSFIEEMGITDEEEVYEKDTNDQYFVTSVLTVRDAYYSDLEHGLDVDEDLTDFFERHSIKWE